LATSTLSHESLTGDWPSLNTIYKSVSYYYYYCIIYGIIIFTLYKPVFYS